MAPRRGTLPTCAASSKCSRSCRISLRLTSPDTPHWKCPGVLAYQYPHLKDKSNQQSPHSLTPSGTEVSYDQCQMHIWRGITGIKSLLLSFLLYKTFVLWPVTETNGWWPVSLSCQGSIATQIEPFYWGRGLEDLWLPPLTSQWDAFPRC